MLYFNICGFSVFLIRLMNRVFMRILYRGINNSLTVTVNKGTEGRTCGMFKVIKRDGQVADFNLTKINDAIMKAFSACEKQYTNEIIDLLALRVTADFQSKVKDGQISVEDVQDSVETALNSSSDLLLSAAAEMRQWRLNGKEIRF